MHNWKPHSNDRSMKKRNKHKGKEEERELQLMGLPANPGSQKTDGGADLPPNTG